MNYKNEKLDKEILDIIEINSFSKKMLAAYKARKIANKLCLQDYGKANYKEYVEMLMHKHFPNEYKKSVAGAKIVQWLTLWFPIIIVALFFLGLGLGAFLWYNVERDENVFFVSYIICVVILGLIVWKLFIPVYKKLK
jgi:ABC-type sugar transport system permease subunit